MATKILIADDTLFMRTLLKDIFQAQNYEIVGEAQTGVEAIEKFQQLQPDLMTMDIVMPFKNGIDAVREIKAQYHQAKIVICSALGQEEMVNEAIKAGASGFIVKPFDEEKVLAVVKPLLD